MLTADEALDDLGLAGRISSPGVDTDAMLVKMIMDIERAMRIGAPIETCDEFDGSPSEFLRLRGITSTPDTTTLELATALQAARLNAASMMEKVSSNRTQLCIALGLKEDESFDRIMRECVSRGFCTLTLGKEPLLDLPPAPPAPSATPMAVTLDPECAKQLRDVNKALARDYKLRRRVLIRRLDVTLQGFSRGLKNGAKEEDMKRALLPLRSKLTENPATIRTDDAFNAPKDLIQGMMSKVAHSGGVPSAIRVVRMGSVPDRGGRADEMRPSLRDMMPNWARRAASTSRPGDWKCKKCGAMVYARKKSCYKCGTPRASGKSKSVRAAPAKDHRMNGAGVTEKSGSNKKSGGVGGGKRRKKKKKKKKKKMGDV